MACSSDTLQELQRELEETRARLVEAEKENEELRRLRAQSEACALTGTAEAQLRGRTAFFDAVLYSSIDAILAVDDNGNKIVQNRRMLELWNIPPEVAAESDSRRQLKWVANQTKRPQEFVERIAYLRNHAEEVGHDEIELKDGRVFGRYSAPVRGHDGKYYGRIWVFRDITERKWADEERKESESRYRSLFEYAPDGIVITNSDGYYIDGNASICRMLGYTRYELIGLHASDIVAPEEVQHIEPAINIILAARSDYHGEWKFRRKDGTTFKADVIATRMPDGNLLGMIRDITEQNRAASRIAEQAALLDKARDAIIVRDLDGLIQFWNKGAQKMYGWTCEEALGRSIVDLIYENEAAFREPNERFLEKGESSGELHQLTKDRRQIIVEAGWTLVRDESGQPKSVLAIDTDITERKKIEGQFLRAQRMESIGTLAGGIAHDLNNILAPILMSVGLLKSREPDPESADVLDTIEVSARRGADIVRQVLSFARGMEGQRIEIQPKHLVKDMRNIIKDTFPKDIRLQFTVPKDTWTILGDPTQVHQILLNLCVNARDAMPHGGSLNLSVENCVLDEQYVSMNPHAKPGRYVQINVADSGTGIPPELLDKIFEPFFTTKEFNKGTGLGLSTVLAVVKSHEGLIDVLSEPGRGTTFKVLLPAAERITEEQDRVIREDCLPRGDGETILVVDDEASILTITSQTLRAFGYRVLTATDGAQAVAAYAEYRNDVAVVLTDMAMPIMGGAAAISVLKHINPAVKIIAASGLHGRADAIETPGISAKYCLTKPYTARTLLKTIRMILDETDVVPSNPES